LVAAEPKLSIDPSQIESIGILVVIPGLFGSDCQIRSFGLVQELKPEARSEFERAKLQTDASSSSENLGACCTVQ
jgi:hypothetical protein